jgi:hypothetical protein
VHASAGFIQLNPRVGLDYRSDAFGVYLLAGGNEGEQTVEFLHIGSLIFPVVINFGQVQLHGCPPNPPNASATCWVQNVGSYNSWQRGILTCRHAVKALSKGNSVALIPSNHHSQPSSSVLVEIDECTIDAAVLEIRAADWPSGLNRLHVSNPSAPGQPVQFEDRNGNFQTGHVLRVFNYPTYYGNLFGQRVIGDCKGVAGDSGSLLTDLKTNKAVGIYMGDIPDGTGGRDGIFQDLSQVEAYFKLAFYY